MNNILNPAIGSNQYKTVFDEKVKAKKKFKIKFATKVKLFVLLVLTLSLAANYLLVKQFMVFHCSEGGYVMSKEKCNELYVNSFDSKELARINYLKNYENQDSN